MILNMSATFLRTKYYFISIIVLGTENVEKVK